MASIHERVPSTFAGVRTWVTEDDLVAAFQIESPDATEPVPVYIIGRGEIRYKWDGTGTLQGAWSTLGQHYLPTSKGL